MAELIRKDKLIDWSYREPQYYDSMNDRTDMRDFINSLPTTTETEIRAKVLNEVLEKVNVMNLWDSRDKDMFRLVVEQLKEE